MPPNKLKSSDIGNRCGSQSGVAAVQFAIVSGLVLVIVFGILEFGLIFLQGHYVADAAREGARIGVRANNFSTFGNNAKEADCLNLSIEKAFCTDRRWRVEREIIEYLEIFYDQEDLEDRIIVTRDDLDEGNDGGETLSVAVQVDNFVPGLFTGLLRLLSGSTVNRLQTISFSTSMAYEDPAEYATE